MFVEAGMHVDSVNLDGLTAAQLATRKYKRIAQFPIENKIPYLISASIEALVRRYDSRATGLKCLASRVIAHHKIPYKDIVPKQLETFIQLHSATKL